MRLDTQKHVVVGISGGVDSAVTAHLMQQAGHHVEAVFMQNWDADDPQCTAHEDLSMARLICDQLHIPLRTANFSEAYWANVFQYFLDEYAAGRTPNPDVLCNREIKFKAFLEHARELGADAIATGHYARIAHHAEHSQLLQGVDPKKDQSYFLCLLSQPQLQASLMPLGDMQKTQVRALAKDLGLANWQRKDSTGICFVGKRKFREFLSEYILAQPGPIMSDAGDYLGQHQGLMFYTLGQREGLAIGGVRGHAEAPWYVVDKHTPDNALIVGQGVNHPLLHRKTLFANELHWISGHPPEFGSALTARIRHGQIPQSCSIHPASDGIQVQFEKAQRAITPGQVVAFYDGAICLGGGIILSH